MHMFKALISREKTISNFRGQIFVTEQSIFGPPLDSAIFRAWSLLELLERLRENHWDSCFFWIIFMYPEMRYLCVLLCSNYADIYGECVITFIRICIEYKVFRSQSAEKRFKKLLRFNRKRGKKRCAAIQNTIGHYALLLLRGVELRGSLNLNCCSAWNGVLVLLWYPDQQVELDASC